MASLPSSRSDPVMVVLLLRCYLESYNKEFGITKLDQNPPLYKTPYNQTPTAAACCIFESQSQWWTRSQLMNSILQSSSEIGSNADAAQSNKKGLFWFLPQNRARNHQTEAVAWPDHQTLPNALSVDDLYFVHNAAERQMPIQRFLFLSKRRFFLLILEYASHKRRFFEMLFGNGLGFWNTHTNATTCKLCPSVPLH